MREKHTLVIEFDNEAARGHFSSWLDGQGEQDYWLWMKYREHEEEGDITALRFLGPGSAEDNVIRTQCGRMDGKESM